MIFLDSFPFLRIVRWFLGIQLPCISRKHTPGVYESATKLQSDIGVHVKSNKIWIAITFFNTLFFILFLLNLRCFFDNFGWILVWGNGRSLIFDSVRHRVFSYLSYFWIPCSCAILLRFGVCIWFDIVTSLKFLTFLEF